MVKFILALHVRSELVSREVGVSIRPGYVRADVLNALKIGIRKRTSGDTRERLRSASR
jgi:hypothetical protein